MPPHPIANSQMDDRPIANYHVPNERLQFQTMQHRHTLMYTNNPDPDRSTNNCFNLKPQLNAHKPKHVGDPIK